MTPEPSIGRIVRHRANGRPELPAIVVGLPGPDSLTVDLVVFGENESAAAVLEYAVPFDLDGGPGTWGWPPAPPGAVLSPQLPTEPAQEPATPPTDPAPSPEATDPARTTPDPAPAPETGTQGEPRTSGEWAAPVPDPVPADGSPLVDPPATEAPAPATEAPGRSDGWPA